MSEDEVKKAPSSQLALLSPAEKYDIWMGRYDYPLANSEWLRTHPTDAEWEGLCHGWAPAAGFYKEPQPMTIKTRDGVDLPFGSADIKALLTYFNAEYVHYNAYFLSERCGVDLSLYPKRGEEDACRDMHAATLHLILTNQIAANEFFVVDVDRGYAVWNQPVFKYNYNSYSSRAPSATAAPGTTKEVRVYTTMYYARESTPTWKAHTYDPVVYSKRYDYYLELDVNNTIIGGSWNSVERSDFAWKNGLPPFSGYFKGLKQLYQTSTGDNSTAMEVVPMGFKPSQNHQLLNEKTGTISVFNYEANYHQSWTMFIKNVTTVTLDIVKFSTERSFDKLKVYEGAKGDGPLLAVLHGDKSKMPATITLKGSRFLFVFVADRTGGGSGFEIKYHAQ